MGHVHNILILTVSAYWYICGLIDLGGYLWIKKINNYALFLELVF